MHNDGYNKSGLFLSLSFRLDLNLKGGKNEADNIVLHISVRFHENAIIRNAKQLGEWGEQEKDEHLDDESGNPIIPGNFHLKFHHKKKKKIMSNKFFCLLGEIFKFYILIGDQQFHIAVNNKPYCTFAYRLPVEDIRTIEVKYDLQTITQIDHRSIYPYPFPPIQYDDSRIVFSNDAPRRFEAGKLKFTF